MANGFSEIMAAPNQCAIKARVLNLERSPQFSDKWLLDIEILESKQIMGPNFARVGQSVKGFTFESISNIVPGSILQAKAEYIGDVRKGQFQLTDLEVIPTALN